jgi:hypothetical protein
MSGGGAKFLGAVPVIGGRNAPQAGGVAAGLDEQRRFAAMQFACSQQCAATGPELVEKAMYIEAYLQHGTSDAVTAAIRGRPGRDVVE